MVEIKETVLRLLGVHPGDGERVGCRWIQARAVEEHLRLLDECICALGRIVHLCGVVELDVQCGTVGILQPVHFDAIALECKHEQCAGDGRIIRHPAVPDSLEGKGLTEHCRIVGRDQLMSWRHVRSRELYSTYIQRVEPTRLGGDGDELTTRRCRARERLAYRTSVSR